ncbi:MAG: type IV secretory system conjugative DNA transfer family protein [Pseudomonadota bacterium]
MADGGNLLASARWADPAYMANKYYFRPGDFWLGRNPHNFDEAIGVEPTEHLFMCASTGSGKGRNVIVNNIALWPGNVVAYDPKGDLPVVCAPARGDGDKHTDQNAMGQKVIVLDPLRHSKCDERYLGYYDPLSSLDPDDDGFRRNCRFVAEMLIKVPEDQGHAEWVKMGRTILKTIIEHVLTTEFLIEEDRNIFTVLNLMKKGRKDTILADLNRRARLGQLSEDEAEEKKRKIDPFFFLFKEISTNPHSSHLRDDGDRLLNAYKTAPKTFNNQLDEAIRGLDWITEDKRFETALIGTRNGVQILPETQKFDPRELKQNPDGLSVFIVMPSDEMETFAPWVQAVFLGIFAAMRRTPPHPDIKHPTLGILDEFSSLGKQDFIANAFDTIRDEGMRLLVVVQQMGWLFDTYGKRAESFVENTCARLFFGNVGQSAVEYLVKALGETEIIKYATTKSESHARTKGTSRAHATSKQRSIAEGETLTHQFGATMTESDSRSNAEGVSHAESRNSSHSTSENWNWNNSVNWSNGKNWGKGNGRTMGRQYGPHIFWEGLEHSTNYGTSLNKNRGGHHSKGGANARGGGGAITDQTGYGTTDTRSSTVTNQTGTSIAQNKSVSRASNRTVTETTGETHTETENESDTWTEGESVAQSFHKKPLVETHEFRIYLGRVPEKEHDHPSYPGLMLAIIGNEQPLLLRRSNYDQDPFFEGLFSEHPKFPMIGYQDQPMLGYEFTPKHILHVELPDSLVHNGYKLEPTLRPYSRFQEGEEVFRLLPPEGEPISAKAICGGRMLDAHSDASCSIRFKIWDRNGAEKAEEHSRALFLPFENEIARKQKEQRASENAAAQKKHQAMVADWERHEMKRDERAKERRSMFVADWVIFPLIVWAVVSLLAHIGLVLYYGLGVVFDPDVGRSIGLIQLLAIPSILGAWVLAAIGRKEEVQVLQDEEDQLREKYRNQAIPIELTKL